MFSKLPGCNSETKLEFSNAVAAAFAQAVLALLEAPERRRYLGAAARRFIAEERGLEGAALRLRNALMPLMLNLGA